MKTAVIGSGAWGTALASLLCKNGHDTTLWCRTPEKAAQMQETHINPRLSQVTLPANNIRRDNFLSRTKMRTVIGKFTSAEFCFDAVSQISDDVHACVHRFNIKIRIVRLSISVFLVCRNQSFNLAGSGLNEESGNP